MIGILVDSPCFVGDPLIVTPVLAISIGCDPIGCHRTVAGVFSVAEH